MVEFYKDRGPSPKGPCRKIMRREGSFIREMVAKTGKTGSEQIAQIVIVDGNSGHTQMRSGSEAAITSDVAASSMMDGLEIASELSETAGKVNINDMERHQVHTHPNGFAGLSTMDIKSYAEDLRDNHNYPDSSLTATMTEDGIVLGGLYLNGEITEEDEAELNRSLSLVSSGKLALMDPTTDDEEVLMDALEAVGVEFCVVSFPQR